MEKNLIMNTDVSKLSEQERFTLISQHNIDKSISEYIKTTLENLSIKIGSKDTENIIELMNKGLLEGWCWQTTESSIVFFNDNDYIERGNLTFSPYRKYWHSWICFTFNDIFWIFDPCLQILVEKDIYYHIFEIDEIASTITSKSVKEDLIYRISQHEKEKENKTTHFIFEYPKNEVHIFGNNDIKSPMYRNSTGYTATINNGTINTLIAHYYFSG